MIYRIFELIMEEARSRKGKDLISNIETVCIEINATILPTVKRILADERRQIQSGNT